MFKNAVITMSLVVMALIGVNTKKLPTGYWESADCYVYYTAESAVFEGCHNGVGYFYVQSMGECFGAYLTADSELIDGEIVELTFKNRETRQEYRHNEAHGVESVTRVDNAEIIDID